MEKVYSKEWYIENFGILENSLNGESKSSFHKIRRDAIAKFEQLGFPTLKNEEWKYTNVSPLFNYRFKPSKENKVSKNAVEKLRIKGLKANLIVFVNGNYSENLSDTQNDSDGFKIESFAKIIKNEPEILSQHFAKYALIDNGFVALNTAFASDGFVIILPDNYKAVNPVHILNITGDSENDILSQPRNLIVTGKNSEIKIIETYHSLCENISFTNVVTEVFIGENSHVELFKIQDENLNSFHINRTQAELRKNSTFTSYSISLGNALIRNDVNTVLDDENITANLYGLYLTADGQHIDNHTLIDHAKPHCRSNESYRGVLNGKSRGVFNGKVFVRPDAQKTNAYQSNKAILLSNEATVDTKPQLEIYADDVKCSHGAAIGQLDEDSVFYLRSRGVGEEHARAMLIRAFANDLFETIDNVPLHEHLNNLVFAKLK